MKARSTNTDDPEMVALGVLAWVLQDEQRAERLLAVTGLTPAGLRSGIGDKAVLGAVMGFLMEHEPDLIACAQAMEMKPEALVEAASGLDR